MRIAAPFVILMALLTAPALSQTRPAQEPPSSQPASTELVYVILHTSMGGIIFELDSARAPKSVANFMQYVDDKAYDGTIFHRVKNNFMIQGGGFNQDMQKRPTRAGVKNEWKNGLKNVRGSIAMARQDKKPDSGTNQFFINVNDNDFLDEPNDGAGYAVFGKVVGGMSVVNAIQVVPTGRRKGRGDVPLEPVVIVEVQRISKSVAERHIKEESESKTKPKGDEKTKSGGGAGGGVKKR